jgi:Ca2+-dependent lipid-binding protein
MNSSEVFVKTEKNIITEGFQDTIENDEDLHKATYLLTTRILKKIKLKENRKICVNVISGDNLAIHDDFFEKGVRITSSDPYAVISLGSQIPVKTNVVKRSLNPVWNQTFIIEINEESWIKRHPLIINLFDEDDAEQQKLEGVDDNSKENKNINELKNNEDDGNFYIN